MKKKERFSNTWMDNAGKMTWNLKIYEALRKMILPEGYNMSNSKAEEFFFKCCKASFFCNIFLLGSLLICWVVVWKPITNLFVKGKAINICCLQENFVFRKQQTFYTVQPKYPPVHPMKNEDNDGYQFQYEYLIKT